MVHIILQTKSELFSNRWYKRKFCNTFHSGFWMWDCSLSNSQDPLGPLCKNSHYFHGGPSSYPCPHETVCYYYFLCFSSFSFLSSLSLTGSLKFILSLFFLFFFLPHINLNSHFGFEFLNSFFVE